MTLLSIFSLLAAAVLLVLAGERGGLLRIGRRAGLHPRRATVRGAAAPYLEGGSGEPVVLLHGFAADKDNFTRIAGLLARRYRVLIPDLPGFGEAGRDPQTGYAIADQVEHLHAFLLQLGLARVHLGGNSMGGFIAAQFAARYPALVASLWLLDAAGTAAAYDTPIIRAYRAGGEMPLLLRSPDQFDALVRISTGRRVFIPWCLRDQLGRRGAADLALHTRIMQQMHASPLLEQQFARIDTPALIVWGGADQVLNPTGAAALQALLPDSRVIVLPGVGHLPMLEAPRRCASDYLAFLRGLGPFAR